MKNFILPILASAVITAVPTASAAGLYGDVGYVFLSADTDGASVDLGAIEGHVGYAFNDTFAIEGELGLGVADETYSGGGLSVTVSENYNVGIFGVANLPVTEKLDLFARAGWVQTELEAKASFAGTSFTESEAEDGFAFGVGAKFAFTDKIYLRADYTRYDISDFEADGFMIGVGMKFSK